jgi:hypothetical protein
MYLVPAMPSRAINNCRQNDSTSEKVAQMTF